MKSKQQSLIHLSFEASVNNHAREHGECIYIPVSKRGLTFVWREYLGNSIPSIWNSKRKTDSEATSQPRNQGD